MKLKTPTSLSAVTKTNYAKAQLQWNGRNVEYLQGNGTLNDID